MARPLTALFARARAVLRGWRMTDLQVALVCSFLAALAVPGLHLRADADPVEIAGSPREAGPQPHDPNPVKPAVAGAAAGIGGAPVAAAAEAAAAVAPATYRTVQPGQSPDGAASRLRERVRWIASTPSIAPVRGVVTSGFGYRSDPLTHGPGIHQGVDIAAAAGQPVHASAEGIVVRAGETSGLGLAVYVAHAYGLSTRYGHMSEIDVRPGQHVQRGDVVGRVGNTGRSTGYHLHYEVRVDGEAVNPLGYLPDDAAGAF